MSADWPDVLARRLIECEPVNLGDWARDHGLNPASVSRGFSKAFGAPPASFRGHNRTKAALLGLRQSTETLCNIAADAGFADQAHMTRAVARLTGTTPGRWRRWPAENA